MTSTVHQQFPPYSSNHTVRTAAPQQCRPPRGPVWAKIVLVCRARQPTTDQLRVDPGITSGSRVGSSILSSRSRPPR